MRRPFGNLRRFIITKPQEAHLYRASGGSSLQSSNFINNAQKLLILCVAHFESLPNTCFPFSIIFCQLLNLLIDQSRSKLWFLFLLPTSRTSPKTCYSIVESTVFVCLPRFSPEVTTMLMRKKAWVVRTMHRKLRVCWTATWKSLNVVSVETFACPVCVKESGNLCSMIFYAYTTGEYSRSASI